MAVCIGYEFFELQQAYLNNRGKEEFDFMA